MNPGGPAQTMRRPALAFALALPGLVAILAGCLGSGGAHGGTPPGSSPLVAAQQVAGCDGPVFSSRVRAREIDVAADPNDRSRLAAAMMVSVPSTRAAPP